MAAEGREAIIFLDKNRITIYSGDRAMQLNIPETVIRDLDVIDKSGFDSLVDTYIKTNKLSPAHVWIVLTESVCFSADITQTDQVKAEDEVKSFLEVVPFDQVLSKKYRSGKGIRVIATNSVYLEAIIEIFEREGFVVDGIVPGTIFPSYNDQKIMDSDFARYILQNKTLMVPANMYIKAGAPVNPPEAQVPQKKSNLLPYLIGAFAVLLAILLGLLLLRK